MKMRTSMLVSLALVMAAAAFGQTAAPYIGEEVSERVWTATDGSQVSEQTIGGKVYRDARGRMRMERTPVSSSGQAIVQVEIVDPPAGVRYALDTEQKVAYRFVIATTARKVQAGEQSGVTAAEAKASAEAARQQISVEPLGRRMMDGIEADGQRIVTTIVPGAESTDKLVVVSTEVWTSKQLGVTLYSRVVDPRVGESSYRLQHVTMREPEAELFQIPEDFKIVDEAPASGN
jgi:hypothetical protein